MKIKLSLDELVYLRLTLLQDKEEFRVIFKNETTDIWVDENIADQISDWASEKLQVVGFDENYNLTEEGIILEGIIDRLLH